MKFMKSVPADRKAHGGFEWPAEVGAIVEAPDWSPEPVCGGGLHGLIDGRGDVDLLCPDADAVWYAFESIDADGNPSDAETVAIDNEKGKCRRAVIRAVGERATVTRWMVDAGCTGVHFGTATAGDGGTATAGYRGTATAGDGGVLAIYRWNGKRWKMTCAEVGENVEPNVAYRLDEDGNFVKA